MPRHSRAGALNQQVAAIAARALVEGDEADFAAARRRAHLELGIEDGIGSADNLAIHRALIEHLELFHASSQAALIERLRRAALKALTFLQEFGARLCGPVWYGTALANTPITLHLFCDEVEAVTRFLLERQIEYHLDAQAFRFGSAEGRHELAVFDVMLGGEWFELVIFPCAGRYRTPLSSLDRRPVTRIATDELEAVIAAGTLFPARRNSAR